MKPSDDFLETFITQINGLFDSGKQAGEDIRHNLRSLIQAQIAKLDVVSREEFDAQQAILEKTRTQIDHLQAQLDELEKTVQTQSKS
jgi:BMFP domain-containing protein YqiC